MCSEGNMSFDMSTYTDGILDVELAQVLAQGKGKLHGIDSSRTMIDASVKAIQDIGVDNSTFFGRCAPPEIHLQGDNGQWLTGRIVCDALDIANHSSLSKCSHALDPEAPQPP